MAIAHNKTAIVLTAELTKTAFKEAESQ